MKQCLLCLIYYMKILAIFPRTIDCRSTDQWIDRLDIITGDKCKIIMRYLLLA